MPVMLFVTVLYFCVFAVLTHQSAQTAAMQPSGTTVVLVSHSMEEIAKNVDRIVVLSDSHVLMSGTPREVFARGDELMTAGLDVPQVTRIAMALRERGLAISPDVYTVEELSAELVALKKGGGRKC